MKIRYCYLYNVVTLLFLLGILLDELACNCNYTNLVACSYLGSYMCNCWMSAYTTSMGLAKHVQSKVDASSFQPKRFLAESVADFQLQCTYILRFSRYVAI